MKDLFFRLMQEKDLPEVLLIENIVFSDPWPIEAFLGDRENKNYVTELDRQVIGYICTIEVMDECTIANIAVHPNWQHQGIGSFMLENLFSQGDEKGINYYYLEVRASNLPAKNLYQKYGFIPIGIRKNYYQQPIEDAIVMTCHRNLNG